MQTPRDPPAFSVLGPLEVVLDGQAVSVGSAQVRALLAVLLVHRGVVVSSDGLADALWGDDLPAGGRATLHTLVSRLRRALAGSAAPARRELIATRAPGYVLDVAAEEVDAGRFEARLAEAASLIRQGEARRARPLLDEALGLWRGAAYQEFADEDFARTEAARLEELKLVAIEESVECWAILGDHPELVSELEALTIEFPYRERLWKQLMLALYRDGRQAEALRTYGRVKTLLGDELGIEPSASLRELETAIIRQDPSLEWVTIAAKPPLPTGPLTFLFSDLVGSTRLWEHDPDAMTLALTRHDEILKQAVNVHGGHVVKTTGDGIHAVFTDGGDAIRSAVEVQRKIGSEPWKLETPLRVRIGLSTGEAESRDGDYYGTVVNRAARLMAVAHGGQVVVSNATHHVARESLGTEIELRDLGEHRLRDLSRVERVFQVSADGLETEFPPLTSLETEMTNLPAQLTSFVGRDDDVLRVHEILENARLVSLVGPGGCGKTRLAIEAAALLVDSFGDGVWFVDLSAVREPSLVATNVLTTLGLIEEIGRSHTDTVLAHLKERETLLVFDNCEQLVDACAVLAERLLRGCPSLRIVATTREPLGVAGEATWRVPSLSIPDEDAMITASLIPQFGALRLFFDRAEKARPGYPRTDDVTAVVVEICRRLDGIPLAIELAAARVRVLSAEDLLTGLSDQLRLLAGGPRTSVPRHQTIAASIAWSHELLSDAERVLFRRIAVFNGGFDLDAAEYVCSGDAIDRSEIFELLGALVDRSLVVMEDDRGSSRFRVLETIRQFAVGQLAQAHEAGAVRSRHLEHFRTVAERIAPLLEVHNESDWMDVLARDHNNLRAALEWSLDDDVVGGLRIATALHYFWYMRGHFTEGARWFDTLLRAEANVPPVVRANALYADSYLEGWGLGHFDVMIPRLETGLTLAREAGDARAAARLLWALGAALTSRQPETSIVALQEAADLARTAGDTWCLSSSLAFLGSCRCNSEGGARGFADLDDAIAVARRNNHLGVLVSALGTYGVAELAIGNYDDAERHLTECLAIAKDVGHPIWTPHALQILASLATRRGNYEEAQRLARDAHTAAQATRSPPVIMGSEAILGLCALAAGDVEAAVRHGEAATEAAYDIEAPSFTAPHLVTLAEVRLALGDNAGARAAIESGLALDQGARPLTRAQLLNLQGRLARGQGDLVVADASLHAAAELFETFGDPQGRADTLEDLAGLAVDRGEFDRGAEIFGSADALRRQIGYVRFPQRQATYDADVERAIDALGSAEFAAALARGPAALPDTPSRAAGVAARS
jgi:predicted ATPase/DNA-binding SARP family transcriptional activator